jgi:hypothetical protein
MLITSVHWNWPSLYINGFTLPEPHAIEIIMDFGFWLRWDVGFKKKEEKKKKKPSCQMMNKVMICGMSVINKVTNL